MLLAMTEHTLAASVALVSMITSTVEVAFDALHSVEIPVFSKMSQTK